MNKCANAMAAKAKAMYKYQLKQSNYQELTNKRSISEIVSYLKNNTDYDQFLVNVNEYSIHRGQLEVILRESVYNRLLNLLKFSGSNDNEFYTYLIKENEIVQILDGLRMINEEDIGQKIKGFSIKKSAMSKIDFNKLYQQTTYMDYIKVLKDTDYYKIMEKFAPKEGKDLDYSVIELALYRYLYEYYDKIVNKNYHQEEAKELREIIDVEIELKNISKIYRLKKYFKVSNNEIIRIINFHDGLVGKKEMLRWIKDLSVNEMIEEFKQSAYKNYISDDVKDMDKFYSTILYNIYKRKLRFSQSPNVILICFIALKSIEVQNIIEVIEGIRYQANMDKIEKSLVY
ncbi:MAG: V-type ATPase subunit [Erysipelotrichaceae bacterium]